MPKQQSPKTIYLSDYQPPDYQVDSIDLHFELHETKTLVNSKLSIKKRAPGPNISPLRLNGEELLLKQVALNGKVLSSGEYDLNEEALILPRLLNLI